MAILDRISFELIDWNRHFSSSSSLSLSRSRSRFLFFSSIFCFLYLAIVNIWLWFSVASTSFFLYIYFFLFLLYRFAFSYCREGGKTKMKYNRMRIAVLSVRVLFPTGMFTCDREVSFRCRAALCGRRLARRLARLCRSSLIRLLLAVISSADCIEGE